MVFKTALFILDHFEDKLLTMRYESIIVLINELPKSDFFYSGEIIREYKRKYDCYNVTSELLARLTQKHTQVLRMSEEGRETGVQGKQKHYVREAGGVVGVYI